MKNKIFYIITLFLIIFTTSINALETGSVYETRFTGNGIYYDNGILYIEQLGNGTPYNTEIYSASLIKYNISSGQYNRIDNLTSTTTIPKMLEDTTAQYYPYQTNIKTFFTWNNDFYYINRISSSTAGGFVIYKKNSTSNYWIKLNKAFSFTNNQYGFGGVTIVNNQPYIYSTTYQETPCTNTGVSCGFITKFTGSENMTNYSLIARDDILGTWSQFQTLLQPSKDSDSYGLLPFKRFYTDGTIENFTLNYYFKSTGFNNAMLMDSYYNPSSSRIYIVLNKAVFSSHALNDIVSFGVNLSTIPSCSMLNNSKISLFAIDCINDSMCVIGGQQEKTIGGSTANYSLLVGWNGETCNTIFSIYNPFIFSYEDIINTTIKSITNDGTTFYMTGKNIFMKYTPSETTSEFTSEYLNICMFGGSNTNILCKHGYSNNSGFYCPIAQQEVCPVTCSDNASYYSQRNITPIDMNYNGYCSSLYFQCQNLNQRTCGTNTLVNICKVDSLGNQRWFPLENCANGYTCDNGYCQYSGNETSITGTQYGDFLGGNNLNTPTKYIIVLLVMVITIIIFSVIGGTNNYLGLGFVTGITLSIFELIIFVVLGWIPIIILITLIIFAIAISGFFIIRGNSNSGGG